MLTLSDGMLLYHGSFIEVCNVDLRKCRSGKDFGKGFYVTTSYDQAKKFIPLTIRKQIDEGILPIDCSVGYISVFRLHMSSGLRVHIFEKADKDWLYFVASNRRESFLHTIRDEYKGLDIIGGKIANDRTSRTLQIYLAGGYGGVPGSSVADRIAIETLLPNVLEDQFCFCTEKAIGALEFLRSDKYEL